MTVKAVEMTRRIRESHYKETKNLSAKEQMQFFEKKSKDLLKKLQTKQSGRKEKQEHTAKA